MSYPAEHLPHPNTESQQTPEAWRYWWVAELSERVEKLEHTIYTGNGRPSLMQQVTEISMRLNDVARTLETLCKNNEQRQSTRYLVLLETLSFAVVTLLSTGLSTWLATARLQQHTQPATTPTTVQTPR